MRMVVCRIGYVVHHRSAKLVQINVGHEIVCLYPFHQLDELWNVDILTNLYLESLAQYLLITRRGTPHAPLIRDLDIPRIAALEDEVPRRVCRCFNLRSCAAISSLRLPNTSSSTWRRWKVSRHPTWRRSFAGRRPSSAPAAGTAMVISCLLLLLLLLLLRVLLLRFWGSPWFVLPSGTGGAAVLVLVLAAVHAVGVGVLCALMMMVMNTKMVNYLIAHRNSKFKFGKCSHSEIKGILWGQWVIDSIITKYICKSLCL